MIYLFKVSACITVLYVVYMITFRKTNHFQTNRIYLLSALLFSFVVPLIVLRGIPDANALSFIEQRNAAMDNLLVADTSASIASRYSLFIFLYYTGAALALAFTLLSMLRPLRLLIAGVKVIRNRQTIVVHPDVQPFSFLGVLFIRSLDEDQIIIEHEMVHIRQRHWIDLLLFELAAIVLWFNPVMYFYRKSISMQHEYLADREVTVTVPVSTYLHCMARQLEMQIQSTLTSSFNTRSIKQRIIMVTDTNNYSSLRYTILFPVIASLIMAFSTVKRSEVDVKQNRELRSPVDVNKLKSGEGTGFGMRFNPATNRESFHTGVDFVLAAGNSVYATADGVVTKAENTGDYGNLVIIEHGNKLKTSSAHLQRILVKAGDRVDAGQLIGTVGSTGRSSGPHLHFEVLTNGKAVDPVPYLNMSMD